MDVAYLATLPVYSSASRQGGLPLPSPSSFSYPLFELPCCDPGNAPQKKCLGGVVCQKIEDLLFSGDYEAEARFVFLQANRNCLEGLDR